MATPNIKFLNGLTTGASFFDISTYLGETHFDVVWGYQLLGTLRNGPPKY